MEEDGAKKTKRAEGRERRQFCRFRSYALFASLDLRRRGADLSNAYRRLAEARKLPGRFPRFLCECGHTRLKRKNAGFGRMFFSIPARYAATNVMMASRSQMVTDVSNWRGDMKLYFYVSRILREGKFPFLPPSHPQARQATAHPHAARLTLLLSLIFAVFSPVLSQQPSKQNSLESVPTAEFARMIREFSEEGGYFHVGQLHIQRDFLSARRR